MLSLRLNKFLASRLGISRRAADEAIATGRVTVDGEVATLGTRLRVPETTARALGLAPAPKPSASTGAKPAATPVKLDKLPKVCYNGERVPWWHQNCYLALHKPVGYVCSRRRQGQSPTIYALLPEKYQSLKTVGRLDRDSSGLILLTDDGDFAQRMTHPSYAKLKVYEVVLNQPLTPLHQQMIAELGIQLPDGVSRLGLTRRAADRCHWQVTMHQGRNRQIRRTFAALGYRVVQLHRIQFGPYQLTGLEPGDFTPVQPR